MNKQLPSPEVLHKLLRYEPIDGAIFWLPRYADSFSDSGRGGQAGVCARWNAKHAGTEALITVSRGYKVGRLFGRHVKAHRVIWAMQTGEWPSLDIDHIDGNPANNAWSNLRVASKSQNMWNSKICTANRSGIKGVSWNSAKGKWQAGLSVNGKFINAGRFNSKEEAMDAVCRKRGQMHAEFARNT